MSSAACTSHLRCRPAPSPESVHHPFLYSSSTDPGDLSCLQTSTCFWRSHSFASVVPVLLQVDCPGGWGKYVSSGKKPYLGSSIPRLFTSLDLLALCPPNHPEAQARKAPSSTGSSPMKAAPYAWLSRGPCHPPSHPLPAPILQQTWCKLSLCPQLTALATQGPLLVHCPQPFISSISFLTTSTSSLIPVPQPPELAHCPSYPGSCSGSLPTALHFLHQLLTTLLAYFLDYFIGLLCLLPFHASFHPNTR